MYYKCPKWTSYLKSAYEPICIGRLLKNRVTENQANKADRGHLRKENSFENPYFHYLTLTTKPTKCTVLIEIQSETCSFDRVS